MCIPCVPALLTPALRSFQIHAESEECLSGGEKGTRNFLSLFFPYAYCCPSSRGLLSMVVSV